MSVTMSVKNGKVSQVIEIDDEIMHSIEVICRMYQLEPKRLISYLITKDINWLVEQIKEGNFDFLKGYGDLFFKN